MALIVEDGSGLTNADSYISLADADTYITNHSASTDWSGGTDAEKEKALRLATQYIDTRFHLQWKGHRTDIDQVLDWPRADVVDADDYALDSDEIPQKLKNAVCEAAERQISGDGLLADIDAPGSISREKVKVGPIEEDVTYMGGKSQVKGYPLIDALLRDFLFSGSTIQRA